MELAVQGSVHSGQLATRNLYFSLCAVETTEGLKAGRDVISYADGGLEMTRVKMKRPVREVFQNFRQEMLLAELEL